MTDPALFEALRDSRLGKELSEDEARKLAESLAFRDLRAGDVLVREGTSDNHLYVIVSGALGVVRRAGSADAVTLLTLTKGDLVGELSFIDETPHYASLVAIGPTRVFALEREKLEALLTVHPQIVYRVMRAIVRTVHEIQRRISMQSAELTNYIYKMHGKY
jgi:CRP/FNR family transcriptional regulator, cyclic AMP receptor protein